MLSSVSLALLFATHCLDGVSIPITNAGFEVDNPTLSDNSWEFHDPAPSGWTVYESGANIYDESSGIQNPTGGDTYNDATYGDSAPEGICTAYIAVATHSEGDGEFGLEQTLTGYTLTADVTYQLTAKVGNPTDNCFDSVPSGPKCTGTVLADGFPGYKLQLLAGGVVVDEDDDTMPTLAEATWGLSTVTFTPGPSHPQLSQTLGVRLLHKNDISSNGGFEIEFDDIQLNTVVPTADPTKSPSQDPSKSPSKYPTASPSQYPTDLASTSISPSKFPTKFPSISPSKLPSQSPTKYPSKYPSKSPTEYPSASPSKLPSKSPTEYPSASPSKLPSKTPTKSPSNVPTMTPTRPPSRMPSSLAPSSMPSAAPSAAPSTVNPSRTPTQPPSLAPTQTPTTLSPTPPGTLSCGDTDSGDYNAEPLKFILNLPYAGDIQFDARFSALSITSIVAFDMANNTLADDSDANKIVTLSNVAAGNYRFIISGDAVSSTYGVAVICTSDSPTVAPSHAPSIAPSVSPSIAPTQPPSTAPSDAPSSAPSSAPTQPPSRSPSTFPTSAPSRSPSSAPSTAPTQPPSRRPTQPPTRNPSNYPTSVPSKSPTTPSPTTPGSTAPSRTPSSPPSAFPSTSPSRSPTLNPSSDPSMNPTQTPTKQPSVVPTVTPTLYPSIPPPTHTPTLYPTPPNAVTTNYQISIEIKNCDDEDDEAACTLDADAMDDIVDTVQSVDDNVAIVSVDIVNDDLVIRVSIITDPNKVLKPTEIKSFIKKEVRDNDEDIFGDVEVVEKDPQFNDIKKDNDHPLVAIVSNPTVVAVVAAVLVICFCGLCVTYFFCQQRKTQKELLKLVNMSSMSTSADMGSVEEKTDQNRGEGDAVGDADTLNTNDTLTHAVVPQEEKKEKEQASVLDTPGPLPVPVQGGMFIPMQMNNAPFLPMPMPMPGIFGVAQHLPPNMNQSGPGACEVMGDNEDETDSDQDNSMYDNDDKGVFRTPGGQGQVVDMAGDALIQNGQVVGGVNGFGNPVLFTPGDAEKDDEDNENE